MDMVWDTYPESSIKSAEQDRRASVAGFQTLILTDGAQKVPTNFNQFLSSRQNKTAFKDFLLAQCQLYATTAFQDRKVYFASNKTCYLFNGEHEEGEEVIEK